MNIKGTMQKHKRYNVWNALMEKTNGFEDLTHTNGFEDETHIS